MVALYLDENDIPSKSFEILTPLGQCHALRHVSAQKLRLGLIPPHWWGLVA